MPEAPRKLANYFLRLRLTRVVRRFCCHARGAVAVEFAFIALPFFALIFAILETALVFVAGQTLETAAADASRLILTGQAQTAGFNQAAFKQAVCDRLVGGLFDCTNGVHVDVKNYSSFSAINNTPPLTDGQFDDTKIEFTPGGPGCIEVVRLYYQWPIYASLLVTNLVNSNGKYHLLVATSVFRNEPFATTGSC
jgi:Flp pilus assembly protein TadG